MSSSGSGMGNDGSEMSATAAAGAEADQRASSNEALLLDHDYDGIQEFDNALPSWWLATFYGAIVFALFYFGYYIIGPGPNLVEEFQKSYAKTEIAKVAAMAKRKLPTQAELYALSKDPVMKKTGAEVFQNRCVSCHGAQGQGGIGPNLTDDYWIHGGKLAEIVKTVTYGVLDKGMPPWGSMMSEQDVNSVVVFVKSLRGTKPGSPKAPQGTLVADLSDEVAAPAASAPAVKPVEKAEK